MQPKRYEFISIFDYNATNGVVIPKYNVVVGGVRYPARGPITRATSFSGLDLFNYIGRPMQAVWDPSSLTLTIQGFL